MRVRNAGVRLGLVGLLVLLIGPAGAQVTVPLVSRLGSAGPDFGKDVTVDGSGNTFVAGYFSGAVDFDPSPTTATRTSQGVTDAFLAKYTATGALSWVANFGGSTADVVHTVRYDGVNLLVCGYFTGTADLDAGPGLASFTSAGGRDAFVASYDTNGNFRYARVFGSTGEDEAFDVAADSARNAYVTGYLSANVTSPALTVTGPRDAFVVKLDAAGTVLSGYTLGGSGDDLGFGIGATAGGETFVTGAFSGTVDFNPGTGTTNLTSAGGFDIYLARFDATGALTFARSHGGTGNDMPQPGAIDVSTTAVALAGAFDSGSLAFGGTTLVTAGSTDAFVAGFDLNGTPVFALKLGATGSDGATRVRFGPGGTVYVTGSFRGTVNFNPAGVFNLTAVSTSGQDAFVAKYTSTGAFQWALNLGGNLNSSINTTVGGGLSVHPTTGAVVAVGRFFATVDFDPGAGSATATSAGDADAFLVSYDTNGVLLTAAARLAFGQQPTNAFAAAAITPAVTVAFQDPIGNPLTSATANVTLALGSNPGNATLSGTLTMAAVNGVATFTDLSLNNAGTGYTLTATSTGVTSATSSAFNITAIGAATQLAFLVQPTSTAVNTVLAPSVQVVAQDASGNTVTSFVGAVTIAIGTNPGVGSLGGTLTRNAVAGVATFNDLTLSTTGNGYTLRATTTTGQTSATSAAFNIVAAGAAVRLAFTTQPPNTSAGTTFAPVVTVQDSAGNTVTSSTVMITLALGANPGSGVLSGTTTVAAVNGVATFNGLSLNRPGTGTTLMATATALTSATSATFNLTPGAANRITFATQPTASTQNVPFSPSVRVQIEDALGNLVTTANNTITIGFGTNPTSANLTGSTSLAAVSGIATFSDLAVDRTGSGYTLSATSIGLGGATSTAFNVSLPAGARLVFTVQPTNTLLGNAIAPAVRVEIMDLDGFTTLPVGDNVSLTLGNPGGASLQGTTTAAAVNGLVTFSDLRVDRLGTGYTLIATATGVTSATSNPFNIIRLATRLTFTAQPSTTNAGRTFFPVVTVAIQDGAGNTILTDTDAITIAFGTNPSGSTLNGTRTVNAINGVATFNDLSVSRGGKQYTLVATASGLTSATSIAFDVRFLVSLPRGFSMVTMPLIPDLTDPLQVIGFTGNFWARWNPAAAPAGAYARYPDAFSFFDTSPGKGYWLRLDNASTVTPVGTHINTATPLVIPLRTGWNQIGNPFSVQLIWNVNTIRVRQGTAEQTLRTAEAAGLVDPFMWGFEPSVANPFTGSYFPVYDSSVVAGVRGALDSGRGYWIRANQDCDLVLPVPSNLLPSRVRPQSPTNGDWLVTLRAEAQGAGDSVSFGVAQSDQSRGRRQILKPPAAPGGQEVSVALLAPGRAEEIGIERRQSLTDHATYRFVVRSQRPHADLTLTWDNLGQAPRAHRFYLVDETTGVRRYMRTTTSYGYRAGAGPEERHFRIELDSSPSSGRLLSQLAVTNSGSVVHSSVVLSRAAQLTARVLSPAGKVIGTPVTGLRAQAGLTTFTWTPRTGQGSALPRGVYLLEVVAVTDEGEEVRALKSLPLK